LSKPRYRAPAKAEEEKMVDFSFGNRASSMLHNQTQKSLPKNKSTMKKSGHISTGVRKTGTTLGGTTPVRRPKSPRAASSPYPGGTPSLAENRLQRESDRHKDQCRKLEKQIASLNSRVQSSSNEIISLRKQIAVYRTNEIKPLKRKKKEQMVQCSLDMEEDLIVSRSELLSQVENLSKSLATVLEENARLQKEQQNHLQGLQKMIDDNSTSSAITNANASADESVGGEVVVEAGDVAETSEKVEEAVDTKAKKNQKEYFKKLDAALKNLMLAEKTAHSMVVAAEREVAGWKGRAEEAERKTFAMRQDLEAAEDKMEKMRRDYRSKKARMNSQIDELDVRQDTLNEVTARLQRVSEEIKEAHADLQGRLDNVEHLAREGSMQWVLLAREAKNMVLRRSLEAAWLSEHTHKTAKALRELMMKVDVQNSRSKSPVRGSPLHMGISITHPKAPPTEGTPSPQMNLKGTSASMDYSSASSDFVVQGWGNFAEDLETALLAAGVLVGPDAPFEATIESLSLKLPGDGEEFSLRKRRAEIAWIEAQMAASQSVLSREDTVAYRHVETELLREEIFGKMKAKSGKEYDPRTIIKTQWKQNPAGLDYPAFDYTERFLNEVKGSLDALNNEYDLRIMQERLLCSFFWNLREHGLSMSSVPFHRVTLKQEDPSLFPADEDIATFKARLKRMKEQELREELNPKVKQPFRGLVAVSNYQSHGQDIIETKDIMSIQEHSDRAENQLNDISRDLADMGL
jgi:hypothetical protein